VTKLKWFQQQLNPDKNAYSLEDVCYLIDTYLRIQENEMTELVKEKNKKRTMRGQPQKTSADQTLRLLSINKKRQDFHSVGFLCPDLTKKKNVQALRDWDGHAQGLQTIQMKRFKADEEMIKIWHTFMTVPKPNPTPAPTPTPTSSTPSSPRQPAQPPATILGANNLTQSVLSEIVIETINE